MKETIRASASNISLAFGDQQSSLRVNLSYNTSLTGSSNDLRNSQSMNNVDFNVTENDKNVSVINYCAVTPLHKKRELSISLQVTESEDESSFQSITCRSNIVQRRKAKVVPQNVSTNGIKKTSQSVEIVYMKSMSGELISQSINSGSCRNCRSNLTMIPRTTEANTSLFNKSGISNGRFLRLQDKCQLSSDQGNLFMKFLGTDNNKHTNPLTLIPPKGYKTCVHNNNREQEHSLIIEGQYFSMSQPVMCSTFIEGTDKQLHEDQQLSNHSCNESPACIKSNTINISVPMDLTNVDYTKQIHDNYKSEMVGNKVNCIQSVRAQNFKDSEESMKAIRSSLNVNTSLDTIREENDILTSKADALTVQDLSNVMELAETSMVVNTSLDNVCQMLHVDNAKKVELREQHMAGDKSVTKNYSFLNKGNSTLSDKSLMKKLRNSTAQEERNLCVNPCVNSEAGQQRLNGKSESLNGSRDSPDIIQGTPYPVSRSVLLKSYLKFNTMMSISNSGLSTRLLDNTTRDKIKCTLNTDVLHSAKDQTVLAPSHTSVKQIVVSNDHAKQARSNGSLDGATKTPAEICKPTDMLLNNNKTGENINISANTPKSIIPVKGKKKLMPLRDDSEFISFTPMDIKSPLPRSLQSYQKHRKRKKKVLKQTLAKNIVTKKNNVKEDYNETVLHGSLFDVNKMNHLETKKKQPRKQKRILRKKMIKKPLTEYLLDKIDKYNSLEENQMELSRRMSSLDEFESCKTIPVHMRKNRSHNIFIVATGLLNGDKDLLKEAVNTLGSAKIELRVTNRTTHVVTAGGRTINLLRGIIRGCWLINLEWVIQSVQNNRWLNPIKYEITEFSKAVAENRKDRLMFGPSYVSDIFITCGFVYIESNTVPSCEVLKELVTSAGGRITEDLKKAKIVIGKSGVKESWILDSITVGELQSVSKYQRT